MQTSSRFGGRLHKLKFYSTNLLRRLVPSRVWQRHRESLLQEYARLSPDQRAGVQARVDYYNKLEHPFPIPEDAERVGDLSLGDKSSAYSGDFRNAINWLHDDMRVSYLFGDITRVPETPHFLKSRPVRDDRSNANSVLLKLNTVRHYFFTPDRLEFHEKKPMAVWRGKSNTRHRVELAERYCNHQLCDIGCTLHKEQGMQPYHRDYLSVDEQLQYQFIVSVEGIDVATNLKWILASNSLCFMRRPRFETWFMEGALIPDHHYVCLRDDHSDLVEKIEYYRSHPETAQDIIANANRHAARFLDHRMEQLITLLVVEKYLRLSRQL